MTDLVKLIAANNARWQAMKVSPQRVAQIDAVAHRLIAAAAKARYLALSARTGVPWPVIAVIHEREASQRWDRSIAQGDRIDRPSVNVPMHRGPFLSWEDAGYDALVKCAPYAAHWTDWSAGGALTLLEQYNGLGYAAGPSDAETGKHYPPQPSPYIWSDTDQYVSGKYVRDHVFKPDVVDPQDGCAALLAHMIALDSSASFGAAPVVPPVVTVPATAPAVAPPPLPSSPVSVPNADPSPKKQESFSDQLGALGDYIAQHLKP
jgi:lysozyme family protein